MADRLMLGNVHGRRDWGHAADYVDAMWRMLQHSDPGDYIVATGSTHSVMDFCEAAFSVAGLAMGKLRRLRQIHRASDRTRRLVGPARQDQKGD